MLKILQYLTLLLLTIFTSSCFQSSKDVSQSVLTTTITVSGSSFVDQYGRQVFLNGVNLVNKNPEMNYIGREDSTTFASFKKWGFNVVRLGVIWDGLEPEPGKYNKEYLGKIDQQIKWAGDAGLFVYLDMHQDLFSVKYSDGAPEWATLDEGKPHYKGEVWSDSYLISPAVQTSWDNFWKNAPVEGGMGLQDYYANTWKQLAERYKGNKTVIGYDLMNEPFEGSEAQKYMPLLFGAYAQVLEAKTGQNLSVEEIAAKWSSTSGRYEALNIISDKELFSTVMGSIYDLNSIFEKNHLQPFYQKVANSIRSVDTEKVLFINHSYFCNSGVATALEPLELANNEQDTLVAYAAHAYDLLVDTENLENSSKDRLDVIFESIYKSGKRMNMPVIIGEWGALVGNSEGMKKLAQTNIDLFNKYHFSNTYWAYNLGIEDLVYFGEALVRPYPYAISGELLSFSFDSSSGNFVCEWQENVKINVPTIFYIPNIKQANLKLITDKHQIQYINNSNAGYLLIDALGKKSKRSLSITFK